MQQQELCRTFMVLAVAVLTLALSGTVLAQMGQPRGAQQPGGLEQEFMQLQQRLAQTQQKAIENNPTLQNKADEMEDLVTEKMRAAGYDPGGIMETLLAAQGKLQDGSLSDAERRAVLESREVREAQQQLQQAQEEIMKDPEVIAAQKALEEEMMAAMRKEEPETDRIIERLEQIQREVQRGGR
jgi:DNA repair ATPase RecN